MLYCVQWSRCDGVWSKLKIRWYCCCSILYQAASHSCLWWWCADDVVAVIVVGGDDGVDDARSHYTKHTHSVHWQIPSSSSSPPLENGSEENRRLTITTYTQTLYYTLNNISFRERELKWNETTPNNKLCGVVNYTHTHTQISSFDKCINKGEYSPKGYISMSIHSFRQIHTTHKHTKSFGQNE